NELRNISDEKEIEDRFYQDLDFGTGGLRGVIVSEISLSKFKNMSIFCGLV
ncbi:Phosphomannomutase, partial [human gut metagenome]